MIALTNELIFRLEYAHTTHTAVDAAHTLRNEFYFCKTGNRDLILLIGDCQTYDPKGHYEVVGKILEFFQAF